MSSRRCRAVLPAELSCVNPGHRDVLNRSSLQYREAKQLFQHYDIPCGRPRVDSPHLGSYMSYIMSYVGICRISSSNICDIPGDISNALHSKSYVKSRNLAP